MQPVFLRFRLRLSLIKLHVHARKGCEREARGWRRGVEVGGWSAIYMFYV